MSSIGSSSAPSRPRHASGATPAAVAPGWETVPERLRARGLRWTPQRRVLVEVLAASDGHVTGAALVERCRAIDPGTIPSTVYRTLDVLEQLGVVRHSHGADGHEQYHVLPATEHGHLYCRSCGGEWDLATDDPAVRASLAAFERRRGFEVDVSHLSLTGRCADCREA
jgi:Fur family ferric uptake transcriptional regulator